jgi:hypothetical protein
VIRWKRSLVMLRNRDELDTLLMRSFTEGKSDE